MCVLYNFVEELFPNHKGKGILEKIFEELLGKLVESDRLASAALVPIICVLAPISEEAFFRGYLIPVLVVGGLSAPVAVLCSAAAFAAIHLDPNGFPVLFGLGVFFGGVYVASGSLLVPMALHALNNTVCVLVAASNGERAQ